MKFVEQGMTCVFLFVLVEFVLGISNVGNLLYILFTLYSNSIQNGVIQSKPRGDGHDTV